MVPVCRQTPPIISGRSTTATRLPSLAAAIAAFWPPGPEPITTRSKSCTVPSLAGLAPEREPPSAPRPLNIWEKMGPEMAIHTEVLIAGAGPAGLMLARDLAAAGARCTGAERRTGGANLTGAFAVHARTLEELDARGMADELIARGTPVRGVRLFGDHELSLDGLPSRFPFTLVTPQYETERVLAARARALGAEIREGAAVIGLRQNGDEVEGTGQRTGPRPGSSSGAGGETATRRRTIRARYLVGADGAGSTVREAVG